MMPDARTLPVDIRLAAIICTRDRGWMLKETVAAVLAQTEAYANAELLVVDNGSTDETPRLLQELARKHSSIRIVREPVAGLYFARRRAILETCDADFLLWIDDDVIPGSNWLEGLIGELLADPTLGVLGPAIEALWEGEPVAWFTPHMQRDVPVMSFPGGRQIWGYPCYPPGVSLAVRRARCLDLYCGQDRIDHPLGLRPRPSLGETVLGEDQDLSELYLRAGYRVASVDHVRVRHRILPFKLTPEWLIEKYRSDGRLRVRFARLTGRRGWNTATSKLLLALPLVVAVQILRPWQSKSVGIQWQAYRSKSIGAWSELLFGPRVKPYRYPTAAGAKR